MSVAARQREWLLGLQALQPRRPILAQASKESEWVPWYEIPADVPLWTRAVLLSEICLDLDGPEKDANGSLAHRLALAALSLGASPIVADSGGKGFHVHIWFNARGLEIPADLFDQAKVLDVDAWRVAREYLADLVAFAAYLTPEEYGTIDRLKIGWNAKRKGSMVRTFGSVGKRGYGKKLDGHGEDWPRGVPALWDATPYSAAIVDRIADAVARARDAAAREREAPPTGDAWSRVMAHPCAVRALNHGAPHGERNPTGLHLLALARKEGMTRAEADDLVTRYLRACGLPTDDKLRERVADVFRSASRGIACPNPMGLKVCANAPHCPARGRLTLS